MAQQRAGWKPGSSRRACCSWCYAIELIELVEAFDVVALAIEMFGPPEALLALDDVGNIGGGAAP